MTTQLPFHVGTSVSTAASRTIVKREGHVTRLVSSAARSAHVVFRSWPLTEQDHVSVPSYIVSLVRIIRSTSSQRLRKKEQRTRVLRSERNDRPNTLGENNRSKKKFASGDKASEEKFQRTNVTTYKRISFTEFSKLQVEVTRIIIDSGRASKIPPIYKRSTASNISFAKGGKFNLLLNRDTDLFQEKEKCSRLSKESSVFHGVRLRPSDSAGIEKTETIPLLSPTMELDLLKETWPSVDLFDNPNTPKTPPTGDEDNTVYSIWEENYQDLSGWCMDTFQGRCAFPIGEFDTNKYSGMKSEDNGISIKRTAGTIGELSEVLLGDQECLEDSSLKVPEVPLVGDLTRSEVGNLQLAIKSEIIDTRSIGVNDVLLLDPIDSSINRTTDDWIQLENVQPSNASPITVQHKTMNHKRANSAISVESPSLPKDIAKNEDNWDTINAFNNDEPDSFDLLSYLCDDNIQSPDGSVISRDSGPTNKSISSIASPVDETSSSTPRYPRRGQKINVRRRDYAETNSSSSSIAAISAALDSVAKMSERSSRSREKRISTSNRGKKRCLDSDSEDRASDGSYRESREKNNEASRKSRQNKKAKEHEMEMRANELEKDNRILKMKVEELDKLVTTMRTAILRSALKKNS